MMIRKFLVSLLSIFILFGSVAASAEEPAPLLSENDLQQQELFFEQMRPVLELTVASSMLCDEAPYEFDAGNEMKAEFAAAFQKLYAMYGFELPEDENAWLQDHYALSLPQAPHAGSVQTGLYIGLFLLELTPSPDQSQMAITSEIYMAPKPYDQLSDAEWDQFVWADMMALLVLQKDEQTDVGWKVSSLHYASAYFSDDTDEPFSPDLSELKQYYNEQYGCSVSYPSLFTDELLQFDESGMKGTLSDGSSSIDIHFAAPDTLSAEAALQDVLSNHADASVLSMEQDDMVCVQYIQDGFTTRWFCKQTQQTLLTVSFSWDQEIHEHFSSLADQIMQSLISEEDTQG